LLSRVTIAMISWVIPSSCMARLACFYMFLIFM
jgi:hypothetical protein